MSMFCYQCQQAAEGRGCTAAGVCGKDIQTACLQDLLTAWCKQIAVARAAYSQKKRYSWLIDQFLLDALYATQANTNFSASDFAQRIFLADKMSLLAEYLGSPAEDDPESEQGGYTYTESDQKRLEEQASAPIDPATPDDIASMVEQARELSLLPRIQTNAVVVGLQELILYGIRGTASNGRYLFSLKDRALAAYDLEIKGMRHRIAERARTKVERDERAALKKQVAEREKQIKDLCEQSREFLDRLFLELSQVDTLTEVDALVESALRVGQCNELAMRLLSQTKEVLFGTWQQVAVHAIPDKIADGNSPFLPTDNGPCILVSGHDLGVLDDLLAQTEGKGVNIYTHGELISAHGYPGLRKYSHLRGHYGTSWYDQQRQFGAFPGAILMTSGCLAEPQGSYFDYIFTIGSTAWPGVKKVEVGEDGKYDFAPLLQAAVDSGGFTYESSGKTSQSKYFLNTGFGAKTAQAMSVRIENAIKVGDLKQFVFIGGCDGSPSDHQRYVDLVESLAADTVILTLGCGKFRFNDAGGKNKAVGSLPRIWDLGQCNDLDALFCVLDVLSKASGYKVNALPIKYYVTWLGQTMIAGLLTLLAMNVKDIVLGPTLPAFITPETAAVLQERFGLSVVPAV